MSLNTATTSKPKTDYGRVGEGSYPARITQIIDLGYQVQTDWQTGEEKTWDDGSVMKKPEVFITYELPTETITVDEEEKPRWLSKTYILSNHEKAALTGVMNAAKVESTNVADLLDKPVGITVGTTSGGKDKITAVAPMMAGVDVAPLAKTATVFDLDNPNMEVYGKLPNFIKEKLEGVMKDVQSPETGDDGLDKDEDIPY